MEMMLKMSESWIVDDDVSSSSDGGDLSTWEIIEPSDSETLEFPLSSSDSDTDSLSLSLSRSPPSKIKKPPILIQRFGCNYYDRRIECHVDGQDESENDDDDENEVDDELVPKGVRLERNRMRKLGKREYSKMTRSKKLPIVYNRPGCVRGKHGLGLKHSLM